MPELDGCMNPNTATPALQRHVLESLLKGGRNVQSETQGADKEVIAASMVKPLQTAIGNWLPNVKVERAQDCAQIQRLWWKSVDEESLIVAFSSSPGTSPSSFLAMPARLVASALAAQLGMSDELPEVAQPTRLGKISIRFAERLFMDMWPAVQPLTGALSGTVTVLEKADIEASEIDNRTPLNLFLYNIKFQGRNFSFAIAAPEINIETISRSEMTRSSFNNVNRIYSLQIMKRIKIIAKVNILIKNEKLEIVKNLKVGNVLIIKDECFSDATLKIRGKDIYKGEVGQIGQNYSFKIAGRPEEIEMRNENFLIGANIAESNLPSRQSVEENAESTVSDLAESENELNRAIADLRGLAAKDKEFNRSPADASSAAASIAMQIPVSVSIVLGSVEMLVSEMAELKAGSTISLDRKVGEPVEVVVNGVAIAKGQIILVEDDQDRFGLRITEIFRPN